MFKQEPCSHIKDLCTRLSHAEIIPDREPNTFIKVLTRIWFRPFGAPKVLEHDEEGAFISAIMTKWLSDVGTKEVLQPKGTHTWMVERHHDLLRQLYSKIRYQANEEGIPYDDDDILAMAVMAKSCNDNCGTILSTYSSIWNSARHTSRPRPRATTPGRCRRWHSQSQHSSSSSNCPTMNHYHYSQTTGQSSTKLTHATSTPT